MTSRKQNAACQFLPDFGLHKQGPSGDGGDSGIDRMLRGHSMREGRMFEGRGLLPGWG